MTLIEMLLRLGCVLVGWMVIYAHLLWLATLRVVGCGADGDALWRLLLGFAPLAALCAFSLNLLRPLPEVHATLRWLAAPLLLLVPLCLVPVWRAAVRATLEGQTLCGSGPAALWELWWAPLQLATLVVVCVTAWRVWRAGATA